MDTNSVEKIVERVCRIHEDLACACSLAPSRQTNALFSALVKSAGVVNKDIAREVLASPKIQAIQPHLHHICSMGEYELEVFWSKRVAGAKNPAKELKRFPYLKNYQELARLEYHALQMAGKPVKRVLFIGAGPLPLSAYCFAHDYQLAVDTLDIDACACDYANDFVSALNLGHRVNIMHRDALEHTDFASYDAVCLAALVGLTAESKRNVIKHLYRHMAPGSVLLVRSAHDLRTLLYPEVSLKDLGDFAPIACLHPCNDVVNSVIIAQR